MLQPTHPNKIQNITVHMSKFNIYIHPAQSYKHIHKHILRTLAPIAAAPAVPPLTALLAALFITSLNVTGSFLGSGGGGGVVIGSFLGSDDDMFVMMIITQK